MGAWLVAWLAAAAAAQDVRSRGAVVPELFGEGVFSTAAWDFFVAFSPDGVEAWFCRANGNFTHFTILQTRREETGWAAAEVAPFSGRWSDADPHVSPDGRRLYFISDRPREGSAEPADHDVWLVERTASGSWSEPRHVGAPVSVAGVTEWSPCVAASGSLYFGVVRDGGLGGNDLWLCRWSDGAWSAPANLGDAVNSPAEEVEPWISPDETLLIFSAQGRAGGRGGFDLFYSRRVDEAWQPARPLPSAVNTPLDDFNPSVSPDGLWLYWSSTRGAFDEVPEQALAAAELERRLSRPGNGLGDIWRARLADLLEEP